jgi:uncharacterized protein YqgC (DUF456 family)
VPFCANCGRELSPAAVSCPNCGHPGPTAGAGTAPLAATRTEGFAIASLASAIGGFFIVPLVGSILAIVFGAAARKRIAQDPDLQGAEMARAGTIIGWVGVVLAALFIVFLIVAATAFKNWTF